MSNTVNPLKYTNEDKEKMTNIPGTSFWIKEKLKREKKASYIDYIMEKSAALKENVELNKFQKRVVENPSNSMIVAHAVGAGKTLSSIAKFEKLKEEGKANKALVVVPASLRDNYAKEGVVKFTDSKANIVGNKQEISSKKYNALDPNADYNIISYEMFRKNPAKYIKESGADTLIADEMHRLRNEGTSTIESFKNTRGLYKNFIGLTGSLVNNGVADVLPLIDVASNGDHGLGPSKRKFEEMFLRRNNSGIYRNVRENKRPVIGFKHKRFLQNEVGKYVDYADVDDVRDIAQIPRKNTKLEKVPISKKQLKIYRSIIKEKPEIKKLIYKRRLETLNDEEAAKAFNALIETRKLMNSVGSVVPGVDLKTSAQITPKTKKMLDDLVEHIQNTPDAQAIVLTNLINGGADVVEAGLQDRGIDYGKFIGKGNKGVTEETRQKDVEDFKKGKKKVMIISGAGSEGLSLNNTTWEALLDPHYNPERMNQMEGRGIRAYGLQHRKPEDREVQVNRYMATMPKLFGLFKRYPYRTPDEMIYEIANTKDRQNKLFYDLVKKYQNKKKRGSIL